MKFLAPATAPAQVAFRSSAAAAGWSVEATRALLWVLNAHPDLIAHARVFKHVAAHLESARCQAEALSWASDWTVRRLHEWVDICQWAWTERGSLLKLPGLEEFDRQPKKKSSPRGATPAAIRDDHPLLGRGISRHPLVGAIWSSHQAVVSYPAPEGHSHVAAMRHFQLQTHVLLAHIESRYSNTQLEEYETYDATPEDTRKVSGVAAVGVALREFTLADFDALLIQLPTEDPTPDFARTLQALTPRLAALPPDRRDVATRCLYDITRYFGAFSRSLKGVFIRRKPRGACGGGGHEWRAGFIHYPEAAGVHIPRATPAPEDEDIPFTSAIEVLIDATGDLDGGRHASERSGLAPEDTLEPAFRLYDPDEIGGRLAKRRYQQRAVEAAAQHLPFAWTRLTPNELCRVEAVLDTAVKKMVEQKPSPSSSLSYRGRVALMLKAMLYLGQSLESVREMEFQSCETVAESTLPRATHLTLLISTPTEGDSQCVRPAGFLLPELIPDYATDFNSEVLGPLNRPRARALLLDDDLGLAQLLVTCLDMTERPDRRIFGMESKTAKKYVAELLSELSDPRITKEKLALVLPELLIDQTGDPSIAWCVTADQSRRNEPRMFYTRHPVRRLREAYRSAAQGLAHDLGRSLTPPAEHDYSAKTEASVGARFVATFASVASLIAGFRTDLSMPRRNLVSRENFIQYHNVYVLYTWLVQSLSTSLRAVRSPNQLYVGWQAGLISGEKPVAAASDKDSIYCDRARLASLSGVVDAQFGLYRTHTDHIIRLLGLRLPWRNTSPEDLPLMILSQKRIEPLTPAWVEQQLAARGFPLPANFHRAFLRTELLARGCAAEVVDAFLGHARAGEKPYGRYASFDFSQHLSVIDSALGELHKALSLLPQASRVVAPEARGSLISDSIGTIPVPYLTAAEAKAGVKAAVQESLQGFLLELNNPHALLLTGRDGGKPDETSARALEALVIDAYRLGRISEITVAEWLRTIHGKLRAKRADFEDLVLTRLADMTPPDRSPFAPDAMARSCRVGWWRRALRAWIRRQPDGKALPLEWRAAVALSAVLHGALLDPAKVLKLALGDAGPEQLRVTHGLSHLAFEQKSRGKGDPVLQRWFPDPLTEMLMWRMPSLAANSSRKAVMRAVTRLLMEGGVTEDDCPSGWHDLVETTRTSWATKTSQLDLQCISGSVETHSIDPLSWDRLFSSSAFLTTPPAVEKDEAPMRESSADIADLSMLHPWFGTLLSVLIGHANGRMLVEICALQGACHDNPVALTYIGWAEHMLKGHSSSHQAFRPETIHQIFRAAVGCLLMLHPDDDPVALGTARLAESYAEALTDFPAHGEIRTLRHGLREFHEYLVRKHGLARLENVGEVLGDEARLRPVDANLISFDEYSAARDWLDGRAYEDWDLDNIRVAKLVLTMGFRLGLRRMEIFGLRLEDIHLEGPMTCVVRPHPGRRLKTENSKRLIPISPFLDSGECEELRSWISRRQKEVAEAPTNARIEYLFALQQREQQMANPDMVTDRVCAAMRTVTGGKYLFMHHLRHSFGTWTYLRLRAPDYPSIAGWFEHLPKTQAALRGGAQLRRALLSVTGSPTRVYAYAVARLLGHSSPAVSLRSYIHTTDLVLAGITQRDAEAIPKAVLIDASGLRPTVAYAALRQSQQTLLEKLRSRSKPAVGSDSVSSRRPPVANPPPENSAPSGWIPLNTIQSVLRAQSPSVVEFSSGTLRDISAETIQLIARNVQASNHLARLSASFYPYPRKLKFPEELAIWQALEPRLEYLARNAPDLLSSGLRIHLSRVNLQKWDVIFKGPQDRDDLRSYLEFLAALELGSYEFVWVLRTTNKIPPELPSWVRGTSDSMTPRSIRVVAPPTTSRASSYAKWIGVKITEIEKEVGPGRAFAVLCWLCALAEPNE